MAQRRSCRGYRVVAAARLEAVEPKVGTRTLECFRFDIGEEHMRCAAAGRGEAGNAHPRAELQDIVTSHKPSGRGGVGLHG